MSGTDAGTKYTIEATGEPAPQPSPVLLKLRAATSPAHKRLERRLPLTRRDLSRADYENILRAYLGFYRSLERRLDPFARSIDGLEWQQRLKTPLLELDLQNLGLARREIDALPFCPLSPVADEAQALGCLYVVEGASLGGQILSRLLRERLGISPATGGAFLAAYGAATGTMWRRFLRCLATVDDPAAQQRVAQAGLVTFSGFESWLEACGVLSSRSLR